MNVANAETVLRELAAPVKGAHLDVGIRGRAPRDSAYLKLTSNADPEEYAVVWTPGDRWFALEVAGRFSHNRFDEGLDDQEVREVLQRYVRAAVAYISGHRSTGRSRWLRRPFVTVHTEDGTLKLR
jgi:hypothetical protein